MKHIAIPRVRLAEVFVVALLVLASCKCGTTPPQPSPQPSIAPRCDPATLDKAIKDCDPAEPRCTDNSPLVNGFPVNGLDADGTGNCNGEAVHVVVNSLQKGRCRAQDANLLMHPTEDRLVARSAAGECSGDGLIGARFRLQRGTAQVELEIAKVSRPTTDRKAFEHYEITYNGGNVCDPATAASVRTALALPARAKPSVTVPSENKALDVIAVRGRIYKRNLEPWPDGIRSKWFNLACVSDALGELARQGRYYSDASYEHINAAGLHMLTASYWLKPYTVAGLAIRFDHPSMLDKDLQPEAHWRARGATCLSEPRLLYAIIPGVAKMPQDLPRDLQPILCKFPARGSCDRAQWIAALAFESGALAPCDTQPADYKSFVLGEETVFQTLFSVPARTDAPSDPSASRQ